MITLQIEGIDRLKRIGKNLKDFAADPVEIKAAVDEVMAETITSVKGLTPKSKGPKWWSGSTKQENPDVHLADQWQLKKGEGTWLIDNPASYREHPDHVILATLEDGSVGHEIKAKNVPDLQFFWEKMGLWFTGHSVNHPGTRPHWMVRISAIRARYMLNARMKGVARAIYKRITK